MARVDVLGVSAITSGGKTLDDTWDTLIHGRQTQRGVPGAGLWDLPTDLQACFVDGFDSLQDLARSAAEEAVGDFRVQAVAVGSSSDSVFPRERGVDANPPRLSHRLAERFGLPYSSAYQFANACASSSTAIAIAASFIESGSYNAVLAGGADEVTLSSISGFVACRIYGRECLPFSVGQRGLILADGAAFVLMASPGIGNAIAYIDGQGLTTGAQDMVGMSQIGIVRAIRAALEDAELRPDEIGLIIAHGTGTEVNDQAEVGAIKEVWSGKTPLVASYKRWIGHPQGASGAIGVALAIKALRTQRIFPTTTAPKAEYTKGVPISVGWGRLRECQHALVLSHGTWDVYSAVVVSI